MTLDATAAFPPERRGAEAMKRLLVGLVAVGLVLAGLLLPLVMPRHCPVNRAACEKIKVGMTLAQVEQILGGPSGDYRTRPTRLRWPFTDAQVSIGSGVPVLLLPLHVLTASTVWEGDSGWVAVWFEEGAVVSWEFNEEVEPFNPGPVAIATWRLGRLRARVLP
jgi:hypothetical protein